MGGVFDFGPAQFYFPKLVDSLLALLTAALWFPASVLGSQRDLLFPSLSLPISTHGGADNS